MWEYRALKKYSCLSELLYIFKITEFRKPIIILCTLRYIHYTTFLASFESSVARQWHIVAPYIYSCELGTSFECSMFNCLDVLWQFYSSDIIAPLECFYAYRCDILGNFDGSDVATSFKRGGHNLCQSVRQIHVF